MIFLVRILLDLNAFQLSDLNQQQIVMTEIKPNIPIIQQGEIWKRNQQFKHWGNFKVFQFVNGQPTYLVTSYISLSLLIIFTLAFGFLVFYDITKNGYNFLQLSVIIRIFLLFSQVYFSYKFYTTDPGIVSHSLPIINQLELTRIKNFCSKCKCMQNQTIKHCEFCDICIENSYVHANVLKTCISQKNVKIFFILWSIILLQSVIYLFRIL